MRLEKPACLAVVICICLAAQSALASSITVMGTGTWQADPSGRINPVLTDIGVAPGEDFTFTIGVDTTNDDPELSPADQPTFNFVITSFEISGLSINPLTDPTVTGFNRVRYDQSFSGARTDVKFTVRNERPDPNAQKDNGSIEFSLGIRQSQLFGDDPDAFSLDQLFLLNDLSAADFGLQAINFLDFASDSAYIGDVTSFTVVPEPASLALLGLGALLMAKPRRQR